MQIHELNTFTGTPTETDYLAVDNGEQTNKVPATALGVSTQMTQAEAEAGVVTDPRVISPAVLASYVTSNFVDIDTGNIKLNTSAQSGDDYNLYQAIVVLGWESDVIV